MIIIETDPLDLVEIFRELADGEAVPFGIHEGMRAAVAYIEGVGKEKIPFDTGRAQRSFTGRVGHRSATFTGVFYIRLLEAGSSRQQPAGFLSEIVEAGIDRAFYSAFHDEYVRHFGRLAPAAHDLIFQGSDPAYVDDIPF